MPSFSDELRDLAKGFRWGRRSLTPATAEEHTPEKQDWTFPTAWARTETGVDVREAILDYLMRPLVWSQTSPEVYGTDNLDGLEGPVLFVSNHSSHLDATLIMTTLPSRWKRRTAVGAAKDYFFDVWWRQAFTALVYGGFPIDRTGGGKGTATASDLVADGWSIVVFPEGARSPDGWMQRFRHGTARMAIEFDVPIVPIGIRGAYQAMPKGRFWPKPGRPPITVRYGRPIFPEEGQTHQELSRRMVQAVTLLHDEDRTSWWDALQRAERGETPSMTGPQGPKWLRNWESSRPLPKRKGTTWR
ncbi:MAG: lysophospholipid acyltransferase family protein [Actinomycetota bacterium]